VKQDSVRFALHAANRAYKKKEKKKQKKDLQTDRYEL